MHSPRKPSRLPTLPKPHTQIQTRRGSLRFYLGDCLDVLRSLTPGTISVIVTSPPYNLGVRYRSYDDTVPRGRYLEWTGDWIAARNAGVTMPPHAGGHRV